MAPPASASEETRPRRSGRGAARSRGAAVARRLLAAYDRQLRGPAVFATTPGATVVVEGPVVRVTGLHQGGMVMLRGPRQLGPGELEAVVAGQVAVFAGLGQPFEWKTFAHDLPEDLPERLRQRGFVAGEPEAVLVAAVSDLRGPPPAPPGVVVRELSADADFERLAVHLTSVWGVDMSAAAHSFRGSVRDHPGMVAVLAAEAGGEIIGSGRAEVVAGTDFCGLWGGATAPEWRGRGVYRLLLAKRRDLAASRGCRLLQVDALPTSRPILERLGFRALTTTVPYRWSPPSG